MTWWERRRNTRWSWRHATPWCRYEVVARWLGDDVAGEKGNHEVVMATCDSWCRYEVVARWLGDDLEVIEEVVTRWLRW